PVVKIPLAVDILSLLNGLPNPQSPVLRFLMNREKVIKCRTDPLPPQTGRYEVFPGLYRGFARQPGPALDRRMWLVNGAFGKCSPSASFSTAEPKNPKRENLTPRLARWTVTATPNKSWT